MRRVVSFELDSVEESSSECFELSHKEIVGIMTHTTAAKTDTNDKAVVEQPQSLLTRGAYSPIDTSSAVELEGIELQLPKEAANHPTETELALVVVETEATTGCIESTAPETVYRESSASKLIAFSEKFNRYGVHASRVRNSVRELPRFCVSFSDSMPVAVLFDVATVSTHNVWDGKVTNKWLVLKKKTIAANPCATRTRMTRCGVCSCTTTPTASRRKCPVPSIDNAFASNASLGIHWRMRIGKREPRTATYPTARIALVRRKSCPSGTVRIYPLCLLTT